MAVIRFELDGTVCDANANFLSVMGYRLEEIKGHHHRMFVSEAEAGSPEYQAFWRKLCAGEFVAGQFKRIAKDGHEVWLQASYNALVDASGKTVQVIKYAADVTAEVLMQKAARKTIDDVQEVVQKACMGDLEVRVREDDKSGDLKGLVQGINHVLSSSGKVLGDIRQSLDAIGDGQLTTRIDVQGHEGGFRDMVDGVNKALDAVIGPLNVAANYVDRISKGDIPPPITDSYKGDFNTIKNNLNTCVKVVNALVADANMLSQAAVEGRLATRADASKHEGDFRKIVQGVNDTLDAVIGPLNVAANYVDRISKG
ncbi:PAS domain-containing protein, partial [Solimonas aquatica]